MGRGGPGEFLQKSDVPENNASYSWHFTRMTDYNNDTPKYANGAVVLAGQEEIPKLRTVSQCEEVLGQAGLVADSRVLRLYAHGTTAGARGARVVPNEPGIVWAPAMEEPADGSTFVALNMGQ